MGNKMGSPPILYTTEIHFPDFSIHWDGFLRVLGSCIPVVASEGTEVGFGAVRKQREREKYIKMPSPEAPPCPSPMAKQNRVISKFYRLCLLYQSLIWPILKLKPEILEEKKSQETHHCRTAGFLNLTSLLNLLMIIYFSESSDSYVNILSRILNFNQWERKALTRFFFSWLVPEIYPEKIFKNYSCT